MAEFTGTYVHTLDEKGRVSVPASFRRQLTGEDLFLNLGLDGCLVIYPAEKWERVRASLDHLSRTQSRQRYFLRRFARYLHPVSVDGQGRISIPSELLRQAGIESEIVFLGQFDSIELWSPDRFGRYSQQEEYSYEEAAEALDIDI
ncbi:division/cell wall cluster transcriptional repressor MraZ [Candidatus Fermentibacterales bacterium]|nr:division/cell wall cluster transcriptional repressor MraZ [Candidatus Fermentibacterales bacterium]